MTENVTVSQLLKSQVSAFKENFLLVTADYVLRNLWILLFNFFILFESCKIHFNCDIKLAEVMRSLLILKSESLVAHGFIMLKSCIRQYTIRETTA